jgi:peptidoglycan-associated lipoprotein
MRGSTRVPRVIIGCILVGALAGSCAQGPASVAQGPVTTATNAPVGQGVNIQPGTEEDFVVNVGRRTFFREGSAELDDTARVTLDKQAAWLSRYPTWKVKVQGFADDSASAERNVALSQKRADAVRSYLSSQGVTTDRMLAKGYGKDPERLIRDCTDASCKAQNRRVVTNLQETLEM